MNARHLQQLWVNNALAIFQAKVPNQSTEGTMLILWSFMLEKSIAAIESIEITYHIIVIIFIKERYNSCLNVHPALVQRGHNNWGYLGKVPLLVVLRRLAMTMYTVSLRKESSPLSGSMHLWGFHHGLAWFPIKGTCPPKWFFQIMVRKWKPTTHTSRLHGYSKARALASESIWFQVAWNTCRIHKQIRHWIKKLLSFVVTEKKITDAQINYNYKFCNCVKIFGHRQHV